MLQELSPAPLQGPLGLLQPALVSHVPAVHAEAMHVSCSRSGAADAGLPGVCMQGQLAPQLACCGVPGDSLQHSASAWSLCSRRPKQR